jgi:cytochrome c oxidase subunit IV
MKRPEWRPYLPYVITWFVLVLLVGAQLLVSRVLNQGNFAPLIGVAMAGLVAFVFMDLRRSNNLARIFAIGGVFWLIILLGLGIMDPLTRVQFAVPQRTTDWRLPVVGPGGS